MDKPLLIHPAMIIFCALLGILSHFWKKLKEIQSSTPDSVRSQITFKTYYKANSYTVYLSLVSCFMGCLLLYSSDTLNSIGAFGVGFVGQSLLQGFTGRTKTLLSA